MRPTRIVILNIRSKYSPQVGLTKDNQVVRALAANRTNDPFDERILPRRAGRADDVLDAHIGDTCTKRLSVNRIAIAHQVFRRGIARKRVDDLLRRPSLVGVARDIDMKNLPTVNREHNEDKENAEGRCRHRKEVDRSRSSEMIFEKRSPTRRRRLSRSNHVLFNGALRDQNSKFRKLTMNARRAPKRIGAAHRTNQGDHIRRSLWTPRLFPGFARPKPTKRGAMPSNHGRGLHESKHMLPFGPDTREATPEQPVYRREFRPSRIRVK
jgi:hypothetical protein